MNADEILEKRKRRLAASLRALRGSDGRAATSPARARPERFDCRETDALQHDRQHGSIKAQQERNAILHGETTENLAGTNSHEAGRKDAGTVASVTELQECLALLNS
jgi:hypothetical protein